MSEALGRFLFQQLVLALDFCHARGKVGGAGVCVEAEAAAACVECGSLKAVVVCVWDSSVLKAVVSRLSSVGARQCRRQQFFLHHNHQHNTHTLSAYHLSSTNQSTKHP